MYSYKCCLINSGNRISVSLWMYERSQSTSKGSVSVWIPPFTNLRFKSTTIIVLIHMYTTSMQHLVPHSIGSLVASTSQSVCKIFLVVLAAHLCWMDLAVVWIVPRVNATCLPVKSYVVCIYQNVVQLIDLQLLTVAAFCMVLPLVTVHPLMMVL